MELYLYLAYSFFHRKDNKYEIYASSINVYVYSKVPKNCSVLDIGCNTGNLGEVLKRDKNCIVMNTFLNILKSEIKNHVY